MTAIHPTKQNLPSDERGLIEAHLEGVDGAFDALFRQFHPRLVTFLARRTGDAAAADDLAQEALIRALHALPRFDTSRPLWPWLRRIATNAAIDWSRSRSRGAHLTTALASQPQVPIDGPDVAERDLLRQALASVPDRQRDALEKCYVEGWRPVDVAGQFGVGSNAFEQLLHRARGSLRRAYNRQNDGDRAAGIAWLGVFSRPVAEMGRWLTDAGTRVRRLGSSVPHLAEATVATVAITALVAIGPGQAPSPRTLDQGVVERSPAAAQPIAPEDAFNPQQPTPGAAGATAAGSGVATGPTLHGAGRDAPAAVAGSAAAPAPDQGPALPNTPLTPPPPGGGGDPSVTESIGGCGSLTREALCTTLGALAQ